MTPLYSDVRRAAIAALAIVTVLVLALMLTHKAGPPSALARKVEQRSAEMRVWCRDHGYGDGYAAAEIDSAGEWEIIGSCR